MVVSREVMNSSAVFGVVLMVLVSTAAFVVDVEGLVLICFVNVLMLPTTQLRHMLLYASVQYRQYST